MPSSNKDLEVLESLAVVDGFDESRELLAELIGPECDVVLWRQIEVEPQAPKISQHIRVLPRQARDEWPRRSKML